MRQKLVLTALIAILFAGCGKSGPNLAEVEGTLTFRGKPFPNVTLCFVPDGEGGTVGPRSVGMSDENGHYKLVCEGVNKPGALVGRHDVLVFDSEALKDPPVSAGAEVSLQRKPEANTNKMLRYSAKYMMPSQTPLHAEVSGPGPQVIDFNVE